MLKSIVAILVTALLVLPVSFHPAHDKPFQERLKEGLSPARVATEAGQEENTTPLQAVKWSMLELPLQAQSSYDNPYVDVTVTATFTGPTGSGITKNTQGFWDGGHTFKVRFTPTIAGTWVYSIKSTPSDAGLVRSGTIKVSEQDPAEHGFLRRDPFRPYNFVFDDGTHFFIMGQTYYDIIENVAGGGSWKKAIRNSKSYGFDKVRILLYSWGPAPSLNGALFKDIIPYDRGTRAHKQNMYSTGDHDRVNISFWRKLDNLISYLKSEGMIADIILFSDGDYTYGTNTQNSRYIRYVLARLSAYTNVIWCMANEYDYIPPWATGSEAVAKANGFTDGEGYTAADAQLNFLGTGVHENDPYMMSDSIASAPRPLSSHQHSQLAFLWYNLAGTVLASNWFTIASIQAHTFYPSDAASWTSIYGDVNGNKGSLTNRTHDMPIVNEEYSYAGNGDTRTVARNAIWGIVIGGGYGTFGGDLTPPSFPIFSGEWVNQPLFYGDIKVMMNFMTRLPYWDMTPRNDKVSSSESRVYALGMAGNYILYVANGGTFIFNAAPSSTCLVERLDPRLGATTFLGVRSHSFSLSTPVGSQDYVYHVYGSGCQ